MKIEWMELTVFNLLLAFGRAVLAVGLVLALTFFFTGFLDDDDDSDDPDCNV